MTSFLQQKQPIKDFSYKPTHVKELEEAGIDIIDIVTAKRTSFELELWFNHFKRRRVPVFAARVTGENGMVKLWIKRTVDRRGKLL